MSIQPNPVQKGTTHIQASDPTVKPGIWFCFLDDCVQITIFDVSWCNLYPAFKGAAGSYNLLVGDTDGSQGSVAKGGIVIDARDPEKGFKSYDWWGTIRSTSKGWRPEFTEQTFSGIGWDRWMLKNLYTSGGDAGFFWDLTDKSGEGFTVVAEDCVGIGRAFGGGICYPIVRPDEPSIFRRCYFLVLNFTQPEMGGKSTGIICSQ